MSSPFACSICFQNYNQSDNRPKTLPCGHTYCAACLAYIFETEARIDCPMDREIHYSDPKELPDNQALKSQLQQLEVRCTEHADIVVEKFCMVHELLACTVCHPWTEECKEKHFVEDLQEIRILVFTRIGEALRNLPQFLSSEFTARDARKYSDSLQENLRLLFDLRNAKNRPCEVRCAVCQAEPNYYYPSNLEAYCSGCTTPHPDLVTLEPEPQRMLVRLLKPKVDELLKDVNFSDLCLELLGYLKSDEPLLLQLAGKFLLQQIRPRADWSSLPDYFYCPGCNSQVLKQTCDMLILPCRSLHALCRPCAEKLAYPLVCPLDKMMFQQKVEKLQSLAPPAQAPKAPLGYNLQATLAVQVVKPVEEWHAPEQSLARSATLPTSSCDAGAGKVQRQDSCPLGLSAYRAPIGVPLPPPDHSGYDFLDRFGSVLPSLSSDIDKENKGWFVYVNRNQVEVVTFLSAESVYLRGVALANPYEQGVTAVVKTVSLYLGVSGTGHPLYSFEPEQLLVGGNGILTDFYFPRPCQLQPTQHYTLKVKLWGTSQLRLFRGSSYERPEVAIGSDFTVWDFEETKQVESGEFLNGQNNLSGPVLRFYYSK